MYRIEAITLPVEDVDRAKAFYEKAGFNLDVDTEPAPGLRVVQLTPVGSDCSITFGTGMPQSQPGSYVNTYLVVPDIEVAHAELRSRGIEISDISLMPSATVARVRRSSRRTPVRRGSSATITLRKNTAPPSPFTTTHA